MPSWNATDLALFYSAENPLCDAAVISGSTVYVHFSDLYNEALGVDGTLPVCSISDDDLAGITPAVAKDTTVTIDGVDYTVAQIKPNNSGKTFLVLSTA